MKRERMWGVVVKATGRLCWNGCYSLRRDAINALRASGLSDREWRKTWAVVRVVVSEAE